MLFVVRFVDHPDRLSVRTTFMQAHLAWLRQQSKQVLVAGSLRLESSANPVGACWIVYAESREEVEELLRTDPFWINGLRQDVEVLYWSKAFPEQVLV